MSTKDVQLWLNVHYRDIRSWIIALLVFGVLIVVFISLGKIRSLGEDNKELINQTKALGLQNERLSKDNKKLTICVGQAFAKFTRDNKPVRFKDINKCSTENGQRENNEPVAEDTSQAPASDTTTQPVQNTTQAEKPPKQPNKKPSDPKDPDPPDSSIGQELEECVGDLLSLSVMECIP